MRSASAGPRRLTALLLLAVFLGAGTTLPGPDALLYHWGKAGAEQPRTHIESAGGCASHLEHCTLGRTATGDGVSPPAGPLVRIQQDDTTPDQPRLASAPRAHDRGALPQPRAPPVAVA
jgi:hypothetical protein